MNEGFPPQIKYIVGNEAAERFSYYGMRAILVVFMVQHLLMEREDATAVYHLFVSACYLFPILGAWISDRFWGKYRTIMTLSVVYCLGHAVLAMWENKPGLYTGLFLIALGSGGIKPCVSAHVGDQFTTKNRHLLNKVFDVFYFSINFGSFFSTLLIPWVLPKFGPGWAFGIPGILMAVATWVFWLGRKLYVHVPPTGNTGEAGFLPILFHALSKRSALKPGQRFLDAARGRYKDSEVDGAQAAMDIFKVFSTVMVFWALFDQHGSSWVLQAKEMDLNVFGIEFLPSQIAALNPIMVMVMIPLFTYGLYPVVEKLGFKMTPLRRMSVGMAVAASSFVAVGFFQIPLDHGTRISVAWQFIPYLLITAAEIMVSITGLEFAYTQAPRAMKSTIMSFWLLTVFAGNFLTAVIAKVNVFKGSMFFFFFAGLMAVVSGIFMWNAYNYKVREYIEDGTYGVDPGLVED